MEDEILQRAKDLLKAIRDNYESCKEAGIDDTGAFIKQMGIAEEMEMLENAVKSGEYKEIECNLVMVIVCT